MELFGPSFRRRAEETWPNEQTRKVVPGNSPTSSTKQKLDQTEHFGPGPQRPFFEISGPSASGVTLRRGGYERMTILITFNKLLKLLTTC